MGENTDQYYEFVLNLVKVAGKIVIEGFNGTKSVDTKKGPWDLVTEYDRRVEEVIFSSLAKKFPSHKFIGEEAASETKLKPELTNLPTWIVDPIDGTNNFVHGLPMICISIGLCINKEVVIGIIYNPVLEQMFTARKGKGAFLNGKKVQASKVTELAQSLLCVEISFARNQRYRRLLMNRMEACVSVAQGVRSLGCAAITLCYIAMGAMDGYQIDGLKCWDVAAGILILTEAGGTILNTDGGPFQLMNNKILCAATKELAMDLVELIKNADASLALINKT